MISLKAFAKVNLSLYITGVRSDGYHLLDTVMQTLSLYDTVEVSEDVDGKITVACDNLKISGEENICHKAATLFFNESKVKGGAFINIVKRIPLAAGLGGGSADAAATLNGLNRLYGNPLSSEKLEEIALKLGADVPFCLKGGTARVKGIGEEITRFENNLPLNVLLIKEGEKPSTGQMYKELDNALGEIKVSAFCGEITKAIKKGDYNSFINNLHNDFSLVWDINNIVADLKQNGADGVCLSGSGPTVMGFFKTKEAVESAYNALKDKYLSIFIAEKAAE